MGVTRGIAGFGFCALLSACGGPSGGAAKGAGAPAYEREAPGDGEIYGMEVGPERVRDVVMDEREPRPDELELIQRLMKEAEGVRGLRFREQFEVRIQSKKAMRGFMRSEVDPRRLRRVRDAYVALGLLDASVTEAQLVEEMSKGELHGYYDPTHKRLVLRDDVAKGLRSSVGGGAGGVWRSVVLHELVHALQDQHFDLESQLHSRRSTDGHHAFMALMEGDATLAMMRFQVAREGLDFDALLGDQPLFDRVFSGLPSIDGVGALDAPLTQRPEVFRYQAGALLAGALMREGGPTSIDRAFQRPPATTRQVLDYRLYLDGYERPKVMPIPGKLLKRSKHELLHEDSMGRIELASYLSAGGPGGDILAAGWEADRLLVFEHDGRLGSIWVVVMGEPEQARVVVERGKVAVAETTAAAGGTFEALQFVDTAVLIRNVDPKVLPRLQKQLRNWVMNGKAVQRRDDP